TNRWRTKSRISKHSDRGKRISLQSHLDDQPDLVESCRCRLYPDEPDLVPVDTGSAFGEYSVADTRYSAGQPRVPATQLYRSYLLRHPGKCKQQRDGPAVLSELERTGRRELGERCSPDKVRVHVA